MREARYDNDPNRSEILTRMLRAGLYSAQGTTVDQRLWVKARDGHRCQFHEYKEHNDSWGWVQCERQEDPDKKLTQQTMGRWRLEVHHIIPQSEMKRDAKQDGGEQPGNLITLCAGLRGVVGHHDIMQPTMIIAKLTHRIDPASYERWIGYAHRAAEIDGMSPYVREWDGMLKSIARTRTLAYTQRTGIKFPFHKEAIRD